MSKPVTVSLVGLAAVVILITSLVLTNRDDHMAVPDETSALPKNQEEQGKHEDIQPKVVIPKDTEPLPLPSRLVVDVSQDEKRRGPSSKLDGVAFRQAIRFARPDVEVPSSTELTEPEWTELLDLYMAHEGRVVKWNQQVSSVGMPIVDARDTSGEYVETVVEKGGFPAQNPMKEGQVVFTRWKRNAKKQRVVRTFRINPGASRELDLIVQSRTSARSDRRFAFRSFFRRVLSRTKSK